VPVLWPNRVVAKAGDTARVSVRLDGILSATRLAGRLKIPAALLPRGARRTQALKDAGFRAQVDLDEPGGGGFTVFAPNGGAAAPRAGPLFEVDLALPATTSVLHGVAVEAATEPKRLLRPWDNVIVVPPP